MNVLFVYPVPPANLQRLRYQQGIGSLSAVLKAAGHRTRLLVQSAFSGEELDKAIREFAPGLVAVSVTSGLFPLAREVARAASRDHRLPVILGGVHPTLLPEESIAAEGVFAICRGEGEHAMAELCRAIEEGRDPTCIANFWVRRGDTVVRNDLRPLIDDLDSLPFPDREIFDYGRMMWDYYEAEFMGSRGCPYRCSYCVNHSLQELHHGKGRYVRFRSVDRLLDEIADVTGRYANIGILGFHDDTFTLNRAWLGEFCRKYPARFGLPFWCNATAGSIDEETAGMLAGARCEEVRIGVESGNDHIRRVMLDKQVSREEIIRAFGLLRRAGIRTYAFNMIGLPGETLATMEDTVRLNQAIKPDEMFLSVFQPYPGTRSYEMCRERGWITGRTVESYFADDYVLRQPGVTKEQVLFYKDIFRDLVRFPRWSLVIKLLKRCKVSRSKSLWNVWRRLRAKVVQATGFLSRRRR